MSEKINKKPFHNSTIPDGWEVSLLDSLAKRGSGHTPDKEFEEYYNGGIKWISLADSYRLDKGLIVETEIEISELGIKKSSAVLHPAGTVVLSRDAGVGKSAVMGTDMAVSQHFIVWRCKEGVLDNWFLYYWLQFKKEYFERQAVGSTIKTIGLPLFKKLTINHPIYSEQKKISHLLILMDTAIEQNNLLVAKKELNKKWLMQNLITGKKRIKGFYGEWKEYHLGSLGETYTGLIGKSKEDFGEGKPFIPYLNIFFNSCIDIRYFDFVKITATDNQNRVQYGDILFTVSSETQNEVGIASVLLDEIEELYLNSFCFGFRLHDFNILSPAFSSYFFRASGFRKEVYKLSQGATRYNLSKTQLMKENIILPPVDEQNEIAKVLQVADKAIQLLKAKTEKFREQKKGLMQVLLTGKKRLKIKND